MCHHIHTRTHSLMQSHKCHCKQILCPLMLLCCCSNHCSMGLRLRLFTFSEQAEDTHRKRMPGGKIVPNETHIFLNEIYSNCLEKVCEEIFSCVCNYIVLKTHHFILWKESLWLNSFLWQYFLHACACMCVRVCELWALSPLCLW